MNNCSVLTEIALWLDVQSLGRFARCSKDLKKAAAADRVLKGIAVERLLWLMRNSEPQAIISHGGRCDRVHKYGSWLRRSDLGGKGITIYNCAKEQLQKLYEDPKAYAYGPIIYDPRVADFALYLDNPALNLSTGAPVIFDCRYNSVDETQSALLAKAQAVLSLNGVCTIADYNTGKSVASWSTRITRDFLKDHPCYPGDDKWIPSIGQLCTWGKQVIIATDSMGSRGAGTALVRWNPSDDTTTLLERRLQCKEDSRTVDFRNLLVINNHLIYENYLVDEENSEVLPKLTIKSLIDNTTTTIDVQGRIQQLLGWGRDRVVAISCTDVYNLNERANVQVVNTGAPQITSRSFEIPNLGRQSFIRLTMVGSVMIDQFGNSLNLMTGRYTPTKSKAWMVVDSDHDRVFASVDGEFVEKRYAGFVPKASNDRGDVKENGPK